MQKFRHFWRKKKFSRKSHLRSSCTKPFNCYLTFQCVGLTTWVFPFYLSWKDTAKRNLPHPQSLSRYLVGRRMMWSLRLIVEIKTTSLNHYQKKWGPVLINNEYSFYAHLENVRVRRGSRILKWGVNNVIEYYFNIWGKRKQKKKKEGGSEKGGRVKIHLFHLPWIRACLRHVYVTSCVTCHFYFLKYKVGTPFVFKR